MLSRIVMLVIATLQSAAPGKPATSHPNIVIVMSDDVGYSDIGCYGGEIPTPNLDALATNGVRFTQFYNTGRCCPSRAALLTGLYPHQAGIGHMLEATSKPGYRDALSTDCVTIAEVLKNSGYRSYMTGKWHLGKDLPLDRGFDRFYGTVGGGGNYFQPAQLVRDRSLITSTNDPEYKPTDYYYTDAITDHSIKFVTEHHAQSPDSPFFLYVAYTAAHYPIQAPADEILKHKGGYDAGYAVIRNARFDKMKKLGIVPGDLKWSDTVGDWDKVTNKDWESGLMEVYAAMITRMDAGVGRLVSTLRTQDMLDNTLILFMNDNGACSKTYKDQPQRSPKESVATAGSIDLHLTYGKNWANVSNTPFRKYKIWTHEGGIATPLIVHWPAGIAPELNSKLIHVPCHLIDVMATTADVTGTSYPATFRGNSIAPLAGKSLLPLLQDRPLHRTVPFFWEHERNCAVREGNWKLVKEANGPWELYNMDVDRAEMNNLADKEPERVKLMADKWQQWANYNDVLPLRGARRISVNAIRQSKPGKPARGTKVNATAQPDETAAED